MGKYEVIPAFDMLLDEINRIISDLNQQGAQLFAEGKYDEAQILITKGQSITEIRDKLQALEKEWEELRVPETKVPEKKTKGEKRKTKTRLDRGLRTQEEDLKIPLLKTLVQMGGSGKVSDVLDQMEQFVRPILTEHDLKPLHSTNELRWRNTTQWARNEMVKEALLKDDSPYGIWEISEEGKRFLEQNYSNNKGEKEKPSPGPKSETWLVPISLSQIVDVLLEMSVNGNDFNRAAKSVARARKLRSVSSIYDKCTRKLGLNVDQFLKLIQDKDKLIKFLIQKYPDNKDFILAKLGNLHWNKT